MAFRYEINRKKTVIGSGGEKYYAMASQRGKITTKQLATEISEMCSLTEVDVRASLMALSQVIKRHLEDGYSVQLENIGRLSISLTSDGFDSAADMRATHVRAKKINFMADKELKEVLEKLEFRKK